MIHLGPPGAAVLKSLGLRSQIRGGGGLPESSDPTILEDVQSLRFVP